MGGYIHTQVRAETVELKAVLDERRTQLSDLRRHLDRESTKNGVLEAEVQHRAARNGRSDARLRGLEGAFDQVLRGERLIESRAAALEADLAVFSAEHRKFSEEIGLAGARLDRADGALGERESGVADTVRIQDNLPCDLKGYKMGPCSRGNEVILGISCRSIDNERSGSLPRK